MELKIILIDVYKRQELDEIAEGEDDYVSALQSFMDVFQPLLDDAYDKMEVVAPKKTGEKCPECGHDLVEPVSYTHLDVYKRQFKNDFMFKHSLGNNQDSDSFYLLNLY